MQRALHTAEHRRLYQDPDTYTRVTEHSGFVGSLSTEQRAPTANLGGLMFNDNQPPSMSRPTLSKKSGAAAVPPRAPSPPPPAIAPSFSTAMQHKLHRAIFRLTEDGGIHNALTDTRPAILVPSSTCPLPMSDICTGMDSLFDMDDIRICRWKAYYELEKQVMEPSNKKYTLALPHHAVVLRPLRPTDLPDNCQLFIMGTLHPEFPYEGVSCARYSAPTRPAAAGGARTWVHGSV